LRGGTRRSRHSVTHARDVDVVSVAPAVRHRPERFRRARRASKTPHSAPGSFILFFGFPGLCVASESPRRTARRTLMVGGSFVGAPPLGVLACRQARVSRPRSQPRVARAIVWGCAMPTRRSDGCTQRFFLRMDCFAFIPASDPPSKPAFLHSPASPV